MRKLHLLTIASFALAFAAMMASSAAQTYTVLYEFGSNGADPNCVQDVGVIAQGRDGNFFSTAADCFTDGLGTAFAITPDGDPAVLHSFNGDDGSYSRSGLTLGTDGTFYGTTYLGGLYSYGTIFKITSEGVVTTLYNFTGGADGGKPGAPPIEGGDGNFYGSTTIGGSAGNNGTVYKITPTGRFTTIHSFSGPTDLGSLATNAPLLQGSDGLLYGENLWAGKNTCSGLGCGTIFKISHSGSFKTLFNFNGKNGSHPLGGLIEGSDGNFYGTAGNGGVGGTELCFGQQYPGCGVVFKITPTGTFTVLYYFTGGSDGANPVAGLVQATDGNFYGTTFQGAEGGWPGWGVLFRIKPAGTFDVLHTFDESSGLSPQGALLQHTNGVLYGTTTGRHGGDGVFYSMDVGLEPFVRFMPAARKVGAWVQFLGQGFTGTTAVSFNGTSATSFTVKSDTYLVARVPVGATTGFVSVTTPGGTLTSNRRFVVNQ